MKAIILAAEGNTLSHTRQLPSCLQPIIGGSNLMDQQIRTLNLFGIKSSDIYVVIGDSGSWMLEEAQMHIRRYAHVNVVISRESDLKTSEDSFYLALQSISGQQDIIAINSDSIFDLRQLESLQKSGDKSSILTRKPVTVNEKGIKLKLSSTNTLSICPADSNAVYPWLLFAGIIRISSLDLQALRLIEPMLNTNGFVYSLDLTLGIEKFANIDYHSLETLNPSMSTSLDLKGGSFARLERKHLVRKEARGQGFEKLTWEIDWLLKLPARLTPYFPTVVDTYRSNTSAWYDMPWYNSPSLRKNILTGSYNAEKACDTLSRVLAFMFSEVYSNISERRIDGIEWLIEKHIHRVKSRVSEIFSNSVLVDLVAAKQIKINRSIYRNIPECLIIIAERPELLRQIAPSNLRMIHGDFHFQNILVEYGSNDQGFILADPRGELNGSDIYYDIGKLWHSFNGLYDLMHTDLCIAREDTTDSDLINYSLDYVNKDIVKTYSSIRGMAPDILYEFREINSDPSWILKTLFAEAMHFCSVSAFHLQDDGIENRAKCMYLMGVQLINNFITLSEAMSYNTDSALADRLGLYEWHQETSVR
jgi:hypothetical protein